MNARCLLEVENFRGIKKPGVGTRLQQQLSDGPANREGGDKKTTVLDAIELALNRALRIRGDDSMFLISLSETDKDSGHALRTAARIIAEIGTGLQVARMGAQQAKTKMNRARGSRIRTSVGVIIDDSLEARGSDISKMKRIGKENAEPASMSTRTRSRWGGPRLGPYAERHLGGGVRRLSRASARQLAESGGSCGGKTGRHGSFPPE